MEYFHGDEKRIVIKKPSFVYPIVKRIFDIVVSMMALICLSPVFLVVWTMNLICKSNRGPLFYQQIRVGLHGEKVWDVQVSINGCRCGREAVSG
jgi:Sugar transferases involved in lipopolysaccharide synthesis